MSWVGLANGLDQEARELKLEKNGNKTQYMRQTMGTHIDTPLISAYNYLGMIVGRTKK